MARTVALSNTKPNNHSLFRFNMLVAIIAYPPMAGGNHFKNLICLDPSFANSDDLNPEVYEHAANPISEWQPVGTVHSKSGRNVHEYLFERIHAEPDRNWIIHGHFGELALFRAELNSLKNKKYIIITIDTEIDRELLFERQERLAGTSGHPYYLHEEQPFLYQPAMYRRYFTSTYAITTSLTTAWHPNLKESNLIDTWNKYLNINIDINQAQYYHTLWWNSNFNLPNYISNKTRKFYGQADH